MIDSKPETPASSAEVCELVCLTADRVPSFHKQALDINLYLVKPAGILPTEFAVSRSVEMASVGMKILKELLPEFPPDVPSEEEMPVPYSGPAELYLTPDVMDGWITYVTGELTKKDKTSIDGFEEFVPGFTKSLIFRSLFAQFLIAEMNVVGVSDEDNITTYGVEALLRHAPEWLDYVRPALTDEGRDFLDKRISAVSVVH